MPWTAVPLAHDFQTLRSHLYTANATWKIVYYPHGCIDVRYQWSSWVPARSVAYYKEFLSGIAPLSGGGFKPNPQYLGGHAPFIPKILHSFA